MRGKNAKLGDTRTAPNGYHYTRTKLGWELTGRIIAGQILGRRLRPNERVRYIDRDRTNNDPSNIDVYTVKKKSASSRKAELEARLEHIKAELEEIGD